MNKWTLAIIAALLVLPMASGHGPEQGPDVLVVDLQNVVETCDEHGDLVGRLKKEAQDLQDKYADQVKELQAQQRDLLSKPLSLRGKDWYPKVEEALKKEGELKAIEAFIKVDLSDKVARGMQALLRAARERALGIMKARGAKIVLASKLGKIKLETDADFKDELISRRVLCCDEGVDITDEVRKAMNEDYAKRK